jgi:hypothetical protein
MCPRSILEMYVHVYIFWNDIKKLQIHSNLVLLFVVIGINRPTLVPIIATCLSSRVCHQVTTEGITEIFNYYLTEYPRNF